MKKNHCTIIITDNMSRADLSLVLDSALFLGFNSTSSRFPVTAYGDKVDYKEFYESVLDRIREDFSNLYCKDPEYVSSTASAQKTNDFIRVNYGLSSFFFDDEFFIDQNFDELRDKINFKMKLPEGPSKELIAAACNFAFRMGMETTACEGGILADECYEGPVVEFREGEDCRLCYEMRGKNKALIITGNSEEYVDFISEFCLSFPEVSYGFSWDELLRELSDGARFKNLDGQVAYAASVYDDGGSKQVLFCEPYSIDYETKVKEVFPKLELQSFKGLRQAYSDEYDIPWEVDVFRNLLNDKLYPLIHEGDEVEVMAALSEDIRIRTELAAMIKGELLSRGANPRKVDVICAYKQGYSWIEEIVLPRLKQEKVERVLIRFKPFLPEGQTEWRDEDGATPSYTGFEQKNPDKWFDLPIRFLQELYPVDDLIARELCINADEISFQLYEGDEDITYLLSAYGEDDREVYRVGYKVPVTERPYLDAYKELGKVHPASSYLEVKVNHTIILSERIKSDIDEIWDVFNGVVLPKAGAHIAEKMGAGLNAYHQPFFSRLTLEVDVSEPERKLEFRQDLISPLDALHEDLYFVATDYFKIWGQEKTGQAFDAPGLVLPKLRVSEGSPKFKVTLFEKKREQPILIKDGREWDFKEKAERATVELREFNYTNGNLRAVLYFTDTDETFVKVYADLLQKGVLSLSEMIGNVAELEFRTEQHSYVVETKKENRLSIDIRDIDLCEDRVIGYESYIRIMEELKGVEGLAVYKAGVSYSGRIIYAIDLLPKNEAGYVSRTKRLSSYPSQIINCRHHANEVSSTNACFAILRELLVNPVYQNIADALNLCFIPFENPDGAEIHYELSQINPYWKLHVARFNAIGKEFFQDVFVKDTINTEALVFRKLYTEKLPDLIVDNHGVPSHEWEQQYSGYTSPSFKGFWLPRAILYGYFWVVPEKEFESNLILAKAIEHEVAVAISEDEELTKLNLEMAGKFEKYAHNWLPKLFPADYYMNMINYWVWRNFSPEQKYVSHRHPWITTVYYTSEVADETAQGDYLKLCARAHFTHNIRILDLMSSCSVVIEKKLEVVEDRMTLEYMRQRPIVV